MFLPCGSSQSGAFSFCPVNPLSCVLSDLQQSWHALATPQQPLLWALVTLCFCLASPETRQTVSLRSFSSPSMLCWQSSHLLAGL